MKLLSTFNLPRALVATLLLFIMSCGSSSNSEERENLLLFTFLTQQADQGVIRSQDGTPIYYRKVGSGTPVVVLHGGPGLDHNYLVEPLRSTIGSGKQLIFFDQRGTGLSGGAVRPSGLTTDFINKEKFLQDLDAIRTQLGLGEKINILGHSWGGLYAMLYASDDRYKDNVKSLALVGSAGANGGYYLTFFGNILGRAGVAEAPPQLTTLQTQLLNNPSLRALKNYYEFLFKFYFADYTPNATLTGTSQNLSQLNLRNATDKTILNGLQIGVLINFNLGLTNIEGQPIVNSSTLADVSKINIPTLLVHGNEDVLPRGYIINAGTNDAVSVQTNIGTPTNQLRTITIANSGHFPFIEQPSAFTEAFQGFYDNL